MNTTPESKKEGATYNVSAFSSGVKIPPQSETAGDADRFNFNEFKQDLIIESEQILNQLDATNLEN